jgi:hypothetical protein
LKVESQIFPRTKFKSNIGGIKLREKFLVFAVMSLMLSSLSFAASPAEEKPKALAQHPVSMFTKSMSQSLLGNIHVKNIVGDPIKVGNVTIIPVILIDVGYGGGGGGSVQGQGPVGVGFGLSGEAKPLGFIVITKEETKFISVAKVPRK